MNPENSGSTPYRVGGFRSKLSALGPYKSFAAMTEMKEKIRQEEIREAQELQRRPLFSHPF